ncbi:Uncharacterised protein [Neisseria gonorrhoeae]|uniref:Uncharacterized protein n=1 Tax=Neisseria gonorrhoeae TaxID=485 RepID=A0A378W137_NEIGO|nr:Uncharacterised protein [Neisseria gonorrhoeae]
MHRQSGVIRQTVRRYRLIFAHTFSIGLGSGEQGAGGNTLCPNFSAVPRKAPIRRNRALSEIITDFEPMRAVGIAETALQKDPATVFDKPSEQSAGCRLVRTPKISAGIFSHLSALSPFALSGCGHRAEQAAVESCFIRTNALAVGKSGRPCQIMRYFGRVLFFVSGGLFCAPSASVWAHGKRRLPYNQMFGDFMQTGIRMPPDISSRFLPIRFGGI